MLGQAASSAWLKKKRWSMDRGTNGTVVLLVHCLPKKEKTIIVYELL
jgi:hypothetical protein